MRRPVAGEVHVHYGQIYVESDPDLDMDLQDSFAGQEAGLCGAAVPGGLFLLTGLHTGDVGFTVEIHDQEPPLDPAWEDVVEVSFRPGSDRSSLVQWGGEAYWDLGLEEIDYRVRYCAKGMDAGNELDTRVKEPQQDCYLLQFWPAPPAPDRIVKQTASIAAYWHDFAREQPPAPTAAERAESERQARLEQERQETERRLAHERWEWGGQLPSEALRTVRANTRGLLPFDPALLHTLDAAGPDTQRAVAVLAARLACEKAGLAGLEWVAAGLDALSEGRPLPPPFDDWDRMWEALTSDPRVPRRLVAPAVPAERAPFQPPADDSEIFRIVGPAATLAKSSQPLKPVGGAGSGLAFVIGERQPMSQPHMALPAVPEAAASDPLQAVINAVHAAVVTYGDDHPTLFRRIWAACGRPAAAD